MVCLDNNSPRDRQTRTAFMIRVPFGVFVVHQRRGVRKIFLGCKTKKQLNNNRPQTESPRGRGKFPEKNVKF